MLDHEQCYRAVQSRDPRFDGWFVTAVRTTGIYCRPSCPAITPRRANVEFHATAAAAQQRGFRACKRCRPDATPGSPEWDSRSDVVARAMRLIADGEVERSKVTGLAARLGYSERQLRRVMIDQVGAAPLALARAQRAQTARLLIETTAMPITEVAFAAGFASVRQFNDTIREVFACSPSQLRGASASRRGEPGSIDVRLPARLPFDGAMALAFLGARVIAGIETWDGTTYARTLRLPHGPARVSLVAGDGHVRARMELADVADTQAAVQRCRRLLDLDADPVAIESALAGDPRLAAAIGAASGLRAPGAVDGTEILVRAVVGQQITVAGARRIAARLVERLGETMPDAGRADHTEADHTEADHTGADHTGAGAVPDRLFPTAAAIAGGELDGIGVPSARLATLRAVSEELADGRLQLDAGSDWTTTRQRLLGFRGIGPWTADYLLMRALGHPDVWLGGDVAVRAGCAALGIDDPDTASERWRPWRTYAVHLMWRSR